MEEYSVNFSDKELEILRESFFAQALESLELLGEEILKFEKNPDEVESLKNIQRYVHTLKGDSASMGFNSLSEAAHRLEDILHLLREDKVVMCRDIADLMLTFVDLSIQIITNSKEGNENAVDTKGFIEKIDKYLHAEQMHKSDSLEKNKEKQCQLTEYQQLQAGEALRNGLSVYNIEIAFDPHCRQKEVGAFMIKTQLSYLGEAICWMPDIESAEIEEADTIKTLFITKEEAEVVRNLCSVTGITGNINVYSFSAEKDKEEETEKREVQRATTLHHDATLRVDAKRVDEIMNLVGELIIGRSMITQSVYELREKFGSDQSVSNLENIDSLFERSLSELQKGVMKIRMVPIDHVFRKFPRIVRDMAIEKGKEIRLDIFGAETELDKGIIDVIGEPLIHIIRNCIDHGIEKKEERQNSGKDKCGVIKINAYHEGGQIIIEIEDDGKGISTERVREKAVEKGIINRMDAEGMNDEDAIDLIFHSGLSTAEEVTETSGRGIGMDAVRKTVEDLKGLIQVRSISAKGTRFTIRLPLTLAIIQGMVFKVKERSFAFPLSAILEIRRVFKQEISTINGIESIKWRDKVISLLRPAEILDISVVEKNRLPSFTQNDFAYTHCMEQSGEAISGGEQSKSFIIIIGLAERRLGILVDKLIGKRELVIKAMDNGSNFISGASILGDGSIVLVLDAASIIKEAVGIAAAH